jgi:general secretion pathway protein G
MGGTIEKRIETLERQYRRLKLVGGAAIGLVLILLGLVIGMGFKGDSPGLVLVDTNGKTCVNPTDEMLAAILSAYSEVGLSLTGAADSAKIALAKAVIGANGPLSQSIDLYKVNVGMYPEELKYLLEKPGDDELAEKWRGPYIKDPSGLKDPWDRDYQYDPEGDHNPNGVDLWSMGPDGIDGDEDDIRNWERDR